MLIEPWPVRQPQGQLEKERYSSQSWLMRADASPHARFRRALDDGQLAPAETAARELSSPSIEETLRLVLLLLRKHDPRFEPAAVKWLGRVLADHPRIRL